MLTGALINSLYPLIGILKPISEIPIVITISVIVLLLCFVCYLRDKDFSTYFSINTQQIFSHSVLSLLLLPFLAVFGTYLMNTEGTTQYKIFTAHSNKMPWLSRSSYLWCFQPHEVHTRHDFCVGHYSSNDLFQLLCLVKYSLSG